MTHNDTKLNNVMLDDQTGEGIAVIDLDTVMPGSLCYDFGDSIRFGCNSGAEDEPDLTRVHFRFDLYETYLAGYLSAVGDGITETERRYLAMGAILMTYECGMRFLTDTSKGMCTSARRARGRTSTARIRSSAWSMRCSRSTTVCSPRRQNHSTANPAAGKQRRASR